MSSPLSNELFFDVHRGLHIHPKELKTKNLGSHWSANYNVSSHFARYLDDVEPKKGVILHAKLPMSSVETNQHILDQKKVDPHYPYQETVGSEQEVTAKDNAPLLVTGKTHYRSKEAPFEHLGETYMGQKVSKRKISYNPPREMKA